MYSYLSRAETYYDAGDSKACGTISYLLWGGKAGLAWSRGKLKELGEINLSTKEIDGRPQNAKYTTDYDLLPKKHPKSSKK